MYTGSQNGVYGPPGKGSLGIDIVKFHQYCNAFYMSCRKNNHDEILLEYGFKKVASSPNPKVVIYDLRKITRGGGGTSTFT